MAKSKKDASTSKCGASHAQRWGVQTNPPFRENFFLHFQKLFQKSLADYVHSNPPLNPEVGPASG